MTNSAKTKFSTQRLLGALFLVAGLSFAIISGYMIIGLAGIAEHGPGLIFSIIFSIPFIAGGLFFASIGFKALTAKPSELAQSEEGVVVVGLPTYEEQYCEYCGAKIPFGSIQCPNCGAYVEKSPDT